jgi:hypothetical protein
MKLTQPSLSSPSVPAVSALALNASAGQGLVRSGLVAEYRFNEGSGQVLHDYSGNNNHGVLGSTTGADTNDPTWTGNGAYFVTDDHIDPGTAEVAVSGAAGATVMCVCSRSASGVRHEMFEFRRSTGGTRLALAFLDTNVVRFQCGATSVRTIATTNTYTSTAYHCITGCANIPGDVMSIQVDQEAAISGSAAFELAAFDSGSDYKGRIGAAGGNVPGNYFNGTIAYLAIYNRVLTQAEISQNYAYLKSYLLRERGIALS